MNGDLAFARDFNKEDGFSKEDYSLKPVQLGTAGGYMFVCLAEEPSKPFAEMEQSLNRYLAPFDLKNAKVAHQEKIVERGNWKMVWENNRECYHCKGSHPELTVAFPDGAWWNGINGTEEEKALVAGMRQHCASLGLPSEYVSPEDASYRLMRIPLYNGASSLTMDGQPGVKNHSLGSMPSDQQVGDVLMYSYPTTWNHLLADHAISFRVMPISPTETEVSTTWLVPEGAVEGVDYDVAELTHVWLNTNDQDRELVERNQIGVTSPAYTPGPYNLRHEVPRVMSCNLWYVLEAVTLTTVVACNLPNLYLILTQSSHV